MQVELRKIGSSVGMIVPEPLLAELGARAGSKLDWRIEGERLIATLVDDARDHSAEGSGHA